MTTASGRKPARCAVIVLFALLGGFLVTALSAAGTEDVTNLSRTTPIVPSAPPSPTLTLSPAQGPAGATVHVEGSGYSGLCGDGGGDNNIDNDGAGESFYFDVIWDGR